MYVYFSTDAECRVQFQSKGTKFFWAESDEWKQEWKSKGPAYFQVSRHYPNLIPYPHAYGHKLEQ